MIEVIGLVLDTPSRARIREALRHQAKVVFCDTRLDLRELMRASGGDAAISQLRDKTGASTLPVIAELRQQYPGAALILYCALVAGEVREILAAAHAGANSVVLRGHDDVGQRLEAIIAEALEERVASRIMSDLAGYLPSTVCPILECCLRNAREQLTVDALARRLARHRNTLSARLACAKLPTLRELIGWSELLVASYLLDKLPLSVNGVARALSFPSGGAFRATLRRYTGLTPRDLQNAGGYRRLLEMFCARLGRPEATPPVADNGQHGIAPNSANLPSSPIGWTAELKS